MLKRTSLILSLALIACEGSAGLDILGPPDPPPPTLYGVSFDRASLEQIVAPYPLGFCGSATLTVEAWFFNVGKWTLFVDGKAQGTTVPDYVPTINGGRFHHPRDRSEHQRDHRRHRGRVQGSAWRFDSASLHNWFACQE